MEVNMIGYDLKQLREIIIDENAKIVELIRKGIEVKDEIQDISDRLYLGSENLEEIKQRKKILEKKLRTQEYLLASVIKQVYNIGGLT
jgi:septal ring factor EnvC (AmiA/AmiB activator)